MSVSHKDSLQKLGSHSNYLKIEIEQVKNQLKLIADLLIIDLHELNNKNTQLEKQLSNIRASQLRMEQTTKSMESEKNHLTTNLQTLTDQLQVKLLSLVESTAQVNEISSEYARLHDLLSVSLSEDEFEPQQRIKELNIEYNNTEKDIHDKLNNIKTLRQQIENLKFEIEDLKWEYEKRDKLEDEINMLESEISKELEQVSELEASYQDRTERNQEIQQKINQLSQTNQSYLAQVQITSTQIEELHISRAETAILEEEKLKLQRTREDLIQDCDGKISQLNLKSNEKLQLQQASTDIILQHDTLALTLQDLVSNQLDLNHLTQLLHSKQQSAQDLHSKLAHRSTKSNLTSEKVSVLSCSLADLRDSLIQVESESTEVTHSLVYSTEELKNLRTSFQALDISTEAEFSNLSQEISNLSTQSIDLQQRIQELEISSATQRQALHSKQISLKQKLIDTQERITLLEFEWCDPDEIRAHNEEIMLELEELKRLNIEYESEEDSSIEILEESIAE